MALFALKSPSLLAFEKDVRQDEVVLGNLKRIFHIGEVPCDTTMREIIDEIPTEQLHKPFTRIFAALQRGKDLGLVSKICGRASAQVTSQVYDITKVLELGTCEIRTIFS